jgi:flagellar biosynthesis protein FlhA
VLATLAVLAASFIAIPGLRLLFAIIAVGIGALAWSLRNGMPEALAAKAEPGPPPATEVPIEELLRVDALAIELAPDLVYLGDDLRGGQLIERVQRIRRQIAADVGVVLPTVRLRDNIRLGTGVYRVLLRGEIIGTGTVVARQILALDPGTATGTLKGQKGVDPVFGLQGFWITDSQRLRAQQQGFTVVDVPTVLTTHLDDLVKRHCHELFGRQQLGEALERISQDNPRLVEELVPDPLPRAVVLKVFRNLVAEGVGVKNTQGILEALAEFAPRTRDPEILTEFVRQRMSRAITAKVTGDDGVLRYVGLAADAEDAVSKGLQGNDGGAMSLHLDPDNTRRLISGVRTRIDAFTGPGEAVLLVPPLARGPIRRLLEKALPRVPVVSAGEIVPGTAIECVGEVSLGKVRA